MNSSTISVTNGTFDVAGALVQAGTSGTNNVTLTNVSKIGSGNGNVFQSSDIVALFNTNILTIKQSTLAGNVDFSLGSASGSSLNTLNLAEGSTLTGWSSRNKISLSVNIDASSQWNVTDVSTLTNLNVEGTLGLTLSGTSTGTALTTAMVAASGTATLGGTLDISLSNLEDAVGKTFTLLSYAGRTGTFDEFLLNDVDVWQSGTAWTFADMLIDGLLISGSVAYSGTALTLAITQVVIPEPGTWALMLGGVGVLGYLQRVRRRSIS